MTQQQMRIPPESGPYYTLHDAASRGAIVDLFYRASRTKPPAACASQYAPLINQAGDYLRMVAAQTITASNSTVNDYPVSGRWAGGCWLTAEQVRLFSIWSRSWQELTTVCPPPVYGVTVQVPSGGLTLGVEEEEGAAVQTVTFQRFQFDEATKSESDTTATDIDSPPAEGEGADQPPPLEPVGLSDGAKIALGVVGAIGLYALLRALK